MKDEAQSFHSGNSKGLRRSVPGTGTKTEHIYDTTLALGCSSEVQRLAGQRCW